MVRHRANGEVDDRHSVVSLHANLLPKELPLPGARDALAGPFALSLFWEKTSTEAFVAGVVISQLVTGYLLLGNGGLPLWIDIQLWEIMAVGHTISTGLVALGSLVRPADFDFESIAREEFEADGGVDK